MSEDRELSALIKDKAPRHVAPDSLRQKIRQQIGTAGTESRWRIRLPVFVASMLGSAALAVVLTLIAVLPRTSDPLLEDLVAGHVRSLQADHLVDVAATDQHTVKPWFNGKLDFSPPVHDFSGRGFPLIGGRLDYVGGRPVAALVYGRRQHLINVFLWPAVGAAPGGPAAVTHQGYRLLHWTTSDYTCWVVSDLAPPELDDFGALLRWSDSIAAPPM